MNDAARLGDFLRSQRCLVTPEEVGLPPGTSQRRVPGLRREEVALLGGISHDYYARIEQGRARRVSPAVLDAIARALLLDNTQRAHLYWLANQAAGRDGADAVRRVAASMPSLPAVVLNHRHDVVDWNPLGSALLAWHLRGTAPQPDPAAYLVVRPNLARMVFLDPRTRALFGRRDRPAAGVAASLRGAVERYPTDRLLTELISELTENSNEFTALWWRASAKAAGDGPQDSCGPVTFDHPVAGRMELSVVTLEHRSGSGERAVVFSAEAGSPSEQALARLACLLPDATRCGTPECG
ncbi:helix-turn-helix transcriptional regulator [Streptomyces sp. R302]|nr:helix-turn-helix transcriptional regulator [Streptomyces sp. R301]NML82305.1 helix-turn-helix transcriptional regulator [Streptomyces sp. R302]